MTPVGGTGLWLASLSGSAATAGLASRLMNACFALLAFIGACLSFLVQPLVAKQLLPLFGGVASVWAACMVFFQTGLLFGYAYADRLARWSLRTQLVTHLTLISAGALALPIIPATHWSAAAQARPMITALAALAATAGVPYVLLAATSPLVQSWCVSGSDGRTPYRLFAWSNLGSLLALLVYPAVLEPYIGTRAQAYLWSWGYAVWVLLFVVCGAITAARVARPATARPEAIAAASTRPGARDYVRWIALPCLSSYLLLAITNHVTHDIAPVPLLWIGPLIIYLLTFVLSFADPRIQTPRTLHASGLAALVLYSILGFAAWWDAAQGLPTWAHLSLTGVCFGCACWFCHGRLALARPPARYLTRYYISVAFGGALGSALVALLAPWLSRVDLDLPIGMGVCALGLLWVSRGTGRVCAGVTVLAGLATLITVGLLIRDYFHQTVLTERNFYASLSVTEWPAGPRGMARTLSNGAIIHGTQFSAPGYARLPTTYYGDTSGVGRALRLLQHRKEALRVGVIGLGVGTLAAYGRQGDTYHFYELNPAVVAIARSQFSYLRDSRASVEITPGDARLSLEREPPQSFDLLALDAFSGDAIPLHLLTREALELYLRHLKPDGLLLVHTTNRYVDLAPALGKLSAMKEIPARVVEDDPQELIEDSSTWIVLTRDEQIFLDPQLARAAKRIGTVTARPWTDDYSDLIELLRWNGG